MNFDFFALILNFSYQNIIKTKKNWLNLALIWLSCHGVVFYEAGFTFFATARALGEGTEVTEKMNN